MTEIDKSLTGVLESYQAADGALLRVMQNRISWVLRTTGHVLRIVHEHSSAPIGFDDGKAILRRETAR